MKNDMVMNAYYQKLQEDNAPGDDEVQSYYEENKATYDSVDYRLTTIEADLPTEPTELADPVAVSYTHLSTSLIALSTT